MERGEEGQEDWTQVVAAVKAGSQLGDARRVQKEVKVSHAHQIGTAVLGARSSAWGTTAADNAHGGTKSVGSQDSGESDDHEGGDPESRLSGEGSGGEDDVGHSKGVGAVDAWSSSAPGAVLPSQRPPRHRPAAVQRATVLESDSDDDDIAQAGPEGDTAAVVGANTQRTTGKKGAFGLPSRLRKISFSRNAGDGSESDAGTLSDSTPSKQRSRAKGASRRMHVDVARPLLARYRKSAAVGAVLTSEDVGKRVNVDGFGHGTLQFVGTTEFDRAAGTWLGVALDDPNGKHDGTVDGEHYFDAEPNHGLFISLRSDKVHLLPSQPQQQGHQQAPEVQGHNKPQGGDAQAADRPFLRQAWHAPAQPSEADIPTQLPSAASPFAVKQITVKSTPSTSADTDVAAEATSAGAGAARGQRDCTAGQAAGLQQFARDHPVQLHHHTPGELHHTIPPQDRNQQWAQAEEDKQLPPLVSSEQQQQHQHMAYHHPHHHQQQQQHLLQGDAALAAEDSAATPGEVTPLHRAAVLGNEAFVQQMLEDMHIPINSADPYGRTPLMYAVHCGNTQCAHYLLSQGADVNCRETVTGSTALHDAAYHATPVMVMLLLQQGANALARDSEGRQPVHWATDNPNAEVMSVFLNRVENLDINCQDHANMTPVMWACFHNREKIVKMLLKHGADLEEKDIDGKTAMHWAVHEQIGCLRLVLTYDATFFKDHLGRTVAHTAAESNATAALHFIARTRAEAVHDPDKNGRTPLHWAAACANVDAVKVLLRLGAQVDVRDTKGATPRDYVQAKRLTWQLSEEQAAALGKCSDMLEQAALEGGDSHQAHPHQQLGRKESSDPAHSDTVSIASSVISSAVLSTHDRQLAAVTRGRHRKTRAASGEGGGDGHEQRAHNEQQQQQEQQAPEHSGRPVRSVSAHGQRTPHRKGDPADKHDEEAGHATSQDTASKDTTAPETHVLESPSVTEGTFLYKLSHGGSGPARRKLFWVDASRMLLHWANSVEDKGVRRVETRVTAVDTGPDDIIRDRGDYSSNLDRYKYAIRVSTTAKPLHLLVDDASTYSTWVAALRALLAGERPQTASNDAVQVRSFKPKQLPSQSMEHAGTGQAWTQAAATQPRTIPRPTADALRPQLGPPQGAPPRLPILRKPDRKPSGASIQVPGQPNFPIPGQIRLPMRPKAGQPGVPPPQSSDA